MGASKKKVLIADDSQVIHQVYAACLGEGFDLIHAYDGAEALLLAVDLLPDLIILDIMMPLLDGREVCRQIKKDPRTKKIVVVMVTARDTQTDRLVGFEVGADDYLEKPCSPDFLMQRITRHLR